MEDEIGAIRKKRAGIKLTAQEGEAASVNAENFIKKESGAGSSSNDADESGDTKRKSKTGRTNKSKGKDAINLTEALYGIHEFLAFLTNIDEIKISKEQAEALSSSIDNLELHLETKISKKTIAIVQLAIVASTIYIPKIGLIKNKLKEKKNEISLQPATH